jgi:hypothetical protein
MSVLEIMNLLLASKPLSHLDFTVSGKNQSVTPLLSERLRYIAGFASASSIPANVRYMK